LPQKLPGPNAPVILDRAIIQRIVAFSIGNYSPVRIALIVAAADAEAALPTQNPAAMPPICYPQDVTTAMIEAFRRQ
jgi:hypothetical protein